MGDSPTNPDAITDDDMNSVTVPKKLPMIPEPLLLPLLIIIIKLTVMSIIIMIIIIIIISIIVTVNPINLTMRL